jgi:hypothetical protein
VTSRLKSFSTVFVAIIMVQLPAHHMVVVRVMKKAHAPLGEPPLSDHAANSRRSDESISRGNFHRKLPLFL